MKHFLVIFFSVLLVGIPATPLLALPACSMPVTVSCTASCCQTGCCAMPKPDSQRAPAVPPSNPQYQISFHATAVAILTLPKNPANKISPTTVPFTAADAPLYARDCALLL